MTEWLWPLKQAIIDFQREQIDEHGGRRIRSLDQAQPQASIKTAAVEGIERVLSKVTGFTNKAPVRVSGIVCDQVATKSSRAPNIYTGQKWSKPPGFPRGFDGGRYKD